MLPILAQLESKRWDRAQWVTDWHLRSHCITSYWPQKAFIIPSQPLSYNSIFFRRTALEKKKKSHIASHCFFNRTEVGCLRNCSSTSTKIKSVWNWGRRWSRGRGNCLSQQRSPGILLDKLVQGHTVGQVAWECHLLYWTSFKPTGEKGGYLPM